MSSTQRSGVVSWGTCVSFPVGEGGGHQLVNRTDDSVRLLVVSPAGVPEICAYPDSGKIGVYGRDPGADELRELYRRSDDVDYYDGEAAPRF